VSDFIVQDEGTIFLLQPLTDAAQEWIDEHIPEDAMYLRSAVVVEHRFICDIIAGVTSVGLRVR
jgi:hypothetical protein